MIIKPENRLAAGRAESVDYRYSRETVDKYSRKGGLESSPYAFNGKAIRVL